MPINRDLVDPEELTSQVRTALADQEINSPQSLAEFLPSETIDDIEYDASTGQGGLIEAATYRAYNAGLQIGRDEALGQLRGKIPPLGQQIPLFEEDRLRLRANAEDGLRAHISRIGNRAARAVAIAVNKKRGELLANGKLNFVGNNQDFEVDFGRRPDFTTVAPALFTDPNSDPLAYLESLNQVYLDENGFDIAQFITSTLVRSAFYRHPKVVNAALGRDAAQYGATAGEAAVNALLAERGLPTLRVKGGRVKMRNNDGTNTVVDLLPRDSIIGISLAGDPGVAGSSELGATYWGTTLEAQKPNWGIADGEQAGIVAAVFDTDDVPAVMHVAASAIAMPALLNPNYCIRAKVV